MEYLPEPDFDELLERSSLGSPVARHLQEQGEEIVRSIKDKKSAED